MTNMKMMQKNTRKSDIKEHILKVHPVKKVVIKIKEKKYYF